MSNPYQSFQTPNVMPPQGYPPGKALPERPAPVTVIGIICLALGALGFLGSLSAIGISILQMNVGQLPMVQIVTNLIFSVLGVFVGASLAIGGGGCLGDQPWAWKLLRMALLVAIGFLLVRMVVNVVQTFLSIDTIIQQSQAQNPNIDDTASSMIYAFVIGGMIVGAVWVFALVAFYAWSWSYLGKPECRTFFGVTESS